MIMKTWVDNKPIWWKEEAEGAPVAIFTVGTLCRNVAGFFFPVRMGEEEKERLEILLKEALTQFDEFSVDEYVSFAGVSPREHLFLSERFLVSYDLLSGIGRRGVFISRDQRFSLMINGGEHLVLRSVFAGAQVEKVWELLNQIDDRISKSIDYMTDSRLGFLTSDLNLVGTGLKLFVILHLPGLARTGSIMLWEEKLKSLGFYLNGIKTGPPVDARPLSIPKHLVEQGFHSTIGTPVTVGFIETVGSLFAIGNKYTLGFSEAEIVFSLSHMVSEITKAENDARQKLLSSSRLTLEDIVGRAEGVAYGAKFLEFAEAIELWSALQLGSSLNLTSKNIPSLPLPLLFELQGGHIIINLTGNGNNTVKMSLARASKFKEIFKN
ncbi:MAG TPA: hypothetical protein PLT82_00520 [Candidatus Hydrogenedens sp.]|nr:hypothetical protein [Candidatus Hydrogenedens sp.]HOK08304.1 hypothetical protein [Candidatus Hydrogenedens sp.]HOL18902.1 hypothetical protein [Candidatus Hydrogenedens sp.]HPP57598.1 hypothetical protein [Candidatus Hydrogenedens sp.]